MSTYKTPEGNTVDINWRNHESKGPDDIDYLLDQVDDFANATKAYRNQIDNIAVVYHVTKNKQAKPKAVVTPPVMTVVPKKVAPVVKKVTKKVTGKKTTKKKIRTPDQHVNKMLRRKAKTRKK